MTTAFDAPGYALSLRVRTGRAALCRIGLIALLVVAACGTAMAEVPGAMGAITAGDCKTAGTAINEGLKREDPQAYFLAGYLYDRTGCVASDPARADRLYRKAAALGDQDARSYLGLLHGLGRGVPQDYARAHRAFAGLDVDDAPEAAASNDIMLGYVETLGRLAERQVGYPISANTYGIEASLDLILDPATGEISFDHVKVGTEVGYNVPRVRTFTDPLEEAYRAAMSRAPKPQMAAAATTRYSAPWQFRMRLGPNFEKIRLEGYATVGPASIVR